MATHSSVLTWDIPWTEEPGGLQSTRLQRVGHGRATKQQECLLGFFYQDKTQKELLDIFHYICKSLQRTGLSKEKFIEKSLRCVLGSAGLVFKWAATWSVPQ